MSGQVGNFQMDSRGDQFGRVANRGWLAPTALVVALVAAGISIWSAVQSPDGGSSAATEALSSEEARTKVCSAFDLVQQAVRAQTNADLGPEPVAREAVAANARLAAIGGGQYLLHHLDRAAPPELGEAIRSFANDLIDVGMAQLAGVPSTDAEQTHRTAYLEAARPQITELCR
ncbi:hypothetical protein MCHIJ_17090 [Mycolicibacterium chitae]|uniref:Putative alanine and proline rich membrane protein n=1 Tax=Mycolicibacterium chitae TaxID=1792 RepID=A0A448HX13_MYCCI|nr:hypothetical protein [Mycolicibacterium chitae]BBZ02272.1 hypothetical protein MCHIJ_17090 [Mycolicibacterium chitae]VEG44530.1 putative alanine and proline rich membrane protein [Mycolicibacterium chitae]